MTLHPWKQHQGSRGVTKRDFENVKKIYIDFNFKNFVKYFHKLTKNLKIHVKKHKVSLIYVKI